MAVSLGDVWRDLNDTAARYAERGEVSPFEALLTEPGLKALAVFRISSWLWGQGLKVWARMLGHHARRFTGMDIHPSARLGRRCVMPQAPVVIGANAVIGDDCLLDAGAMVLGGPRVGNAVVLEPGAIVSGEVFIGHDVRVMAGAVITRDIPDGGQGVGVPGRVLGKAQAKPDPEARAVQALAERLYHLEEQHQILAFATRQHAAKGEQWRTREPDQYGPIPAVEELIDGSGI